MLKIEFGASDLLIGKRGSCYAILENGKVDFYTRDIEKVLDVRKVLRKTRAKSKLTGYPTESNVLFRLQFTSYHLYKISDLFITRATKSDEVYIKDFLRYSELVKI